MILLGALHHRHPQRAKILDERRDAGDIGDEHRGHIERASE